MEKNEWFASWFDSPYYHILYKNHDDKDAQFFLRNLVQHLQPKTQATMIDLACGKGRHSIFLNSLGFDVTGVDLSPQSIASAKMHENNHLHFEVQDLRHLQLEQQFDFALNLFTSFGYFDCHDTNVEVLKGVHRNLKPNGKLVIDFMNSAKVVQHMPYQGSKTEDGITFHITKEVVSDMIVKDIRFDANGQTHHFQEKVQTLGLPEFTSLLEETGFELLTTFGSYGLTPFEEQTADRLILIAEKHA